MSRMTSNPYELRRATEQCASTGAELRAGDAIVAALAERAADDGFDRVDVHVEAWEGGWRPPRLFAHWHTTVPTPQTKRNPLIDDRALLDLFDSLTDADRADTRRLAFRHLLALILIRKRLLFQVGSHAASGAKPAAILVRSRGVPVETPPERVLVPEITPELVQALTRQLSDILSPEG